MCGVSSMVALVIPGNFQLGKKLRSFFRIQPELIDRVELNPANFVLSGRSAGHKNFGLTINFHINVAWRTISRVPGNCGAPKRLIWITGWNRVGGSRQNRLCACSARGLLSMRIVACVEQNADRYA